MELITLEGNHHDIGFQHGRKLSSVINESVIPFVREDMRNLHIANEQAQKIAEKYEDLIGKYSPEILEETHGLAEGAGIEYTTGLLILLFWEVRNTIDHASPECSSFVAAGDATIDGSPIAAQNSDWPKVMIDKGIAQPFLVRPKNGNDFIGRGLAGNLGRPSVIGFNEKGLSFVGSGIHQVQGVGFGFPPLIITRVGLEKCSTVDEFLELVKRIPEWSHAGENVDVVDSDGHMARISFTTKRTMIVQTRNHFLASANHYHNREMRHFGPADREAYPSSYARYDRIVELLRENYGKVDGELARRIMSDHRYGDDPPEADKSVCRHGEDKETMGNLISLPRKREFWISEGTPCKGKYSIFKL